ncbi:MAG TPA: hypothetical protein VJB14_06915 [Planctomycetota bacterium]|nr:hypothetical protein [Planctomycetota bacterium]
MEATLQRPLVRPPGRRAAAPSPGGFRLGRVAGIELRAHASWLIIAILIVLSLEAEFALRHPELLPAHRWAAAAVAAALFFGRSSRWRTRAECWAS